jgi:hypothetical protein
VPFKRRHTAAIHPEYVEKFPPKGFGFGVFAGFALPFLGKANGSIF